METRMEVDFGPKENIYRVVFSNGETWETRDDDVAFELQVAIAKLNAMRNTK